MVLELYLTINVQIFDLFQTDIKVLMIKYIDQGFFGWSILVAGSLFCLCMMRLSGDACAYMYENAGSQFLRSD